MKVASTVLNGSRGLQSPPRPLIISSPVDSSIVSISKIILQSWATEQDHKPSRFPFNLWVFRDGIKGSSDNKVITEMTFSCSWGFFFTNLLNDLLKLFS